MSQDIEVVEPREFKRFPKGSYRRRPASVCCVCGVKVSGRSLPKRYCSDCLEKTTKARARESFETLKWDAVGEKIKHNGMRCERCLDRKARAGFSFCWDCSVCEWCRKNKPLPKKVWCKDCYAKHRRAMKSPELMRRRNNRRKEKYRNNQEYRKKLLIKSKESKKRITKNRQEHYEKSPKTCSYHFCENLISFNRANHMRSRFKNRYCSDECQQKAKRFRRKPALLTRKCQAHNCDKSISVEKHGKAKYCSKRCAHRVHMKNHRARRREKNPQS